MCITLHVVWKWNPIIVFHFFLSTVITWLTVCFLNSYRWHMGERYLMELNLTTDWMVSWWIFVIRIHMYFRNNWLAFLSFFFWHLGFLALMLSVIGFAACVYFKVKVALVYETFLGIITATLIWSVLVSVTVYVMARVQKKGLSPGGNTGSWTWNIFCNRAIKITAECWKSLAILVIIKSFESHIYWIVSEKFSFNSWNFVQHEYSVAEPNFCQ